MKTLTKEMELINPPTLACTGLKISKHFDLLFHLKATERNRAAAQSSGERLRHPASAFWRLPKSTEVLGETGTKKKSGQLKMKSKLNCSLKGLEAGCWLLLESGKNCCDVSWLVLLLIMSHHTSFSWEFLLSVSNKKTKRSLKIPITNQHPSSCGKSRKRLLQAVPKNHRRRNSGSDCKPGCF